MEAINRIASSSVQYKRMLSFDVQFLISRWQTQFERQKRFDFDNPQFLSDDINRILTGLSKFRFDSVWFEKKRLAIPPLIEKYQSFTDMNHIFCSLSIVIHEDLVNKRISSRRPFSILQNNVQQYRTSSKM